MSRPFRFGSMSMPFTPFAQLVEQAQAAEDAGFDLFLLPDFPGAVSPIATLAALAGHTSTLRFSPLVVNAGLWRPDLLVREFLSADQISAGRVEIGLGAGNAAGGPAKPLTHLREVVQAMRASLDNAANPPGWVSKPPIVIAGSGDNLLNAAGELADIIGLAGPFPPPSGLAPGHIPLLSPAATAGRIDVVRAAAGDRFEQIELNIGAEVHITTDRRAAAEQARQIHNYLRVEEILASPKFLAGTVEQIAEQLAGHRERYGLSYFALIGISPAEFAPVIAALR
jgi:probable F420-dependent oxidoreductase